MKTKAVIFDLDGTLMDTLGDISAGVSFALQQQGRAIPTLAQYRTYIGDGPKVLLQRALGQDVSAETFSSLYDCYFDYYCRHPAVYTCVYPQILPALQVCRDAGLPMAVNTNKQQVLAELLIKEKLSGFSFSAIVGQQENRPLKPDPAGALQIAEILSVSPEDILFVGDSFQDVLTADHAGMTPLSVLWGYQSEETIRSNGGRYFYRDGVSLRDAIVGGI